MKKIFYLCAVLSMAMLTSCKTDYGLSYKVAVTGDGDGLVNVQFPKGHFVMNGNAALDFYVFDSIPFANADFRYLTKQEVIKSNNAKYFAALDYVQAEVAKINATDASGTYDLLIDGYVLVYPLNICVKINKRLSNRANIPNAPPRYDLAADKWSFIE